MTSKELEREELWEKIEHVVATCAIVGNPTHRKLAQYLKVGNEYEVRNTIYKRISYIHPNFHMLL